MASSYSRRATLLLLLERGSSNSAMPEDEEKLRDVFEKYASLDAGVERTMGVTELSRALLAMGTQVQGGKVH